MRALLLASSLLTAACGSKQPATTTTATGGSGAATDERPATTRREPGSPYDAETWTAKLGDEREVERAVTQLEQLGDPRAIKPLGEAWLEQGRPVRMLQVVIILARPLTADEAKAAFLTDYEKAGRKASWDVALPYLARAVTEMDDANPRSVDSATKAADALGEARLGVEHLIELAMRPITKKSIVAQVAAVRALGAQAGSDDAVKALAKLISRDPPAHPRTASDAKVGRMLEEAFGLHLAVTGASVNAIAQLRTPKAIGALVLAMYRTPELFTQLRRALVASGPTATAELREALAGKHKAVNALFTKHKLGEYCGDRGDQPCQPTSAMTFYPAVVLGDFNDLAVVPDLLAVLGKPALPPYYMDDAPAPNTQYNAVFDSLARLGAVDAAVPVLKLIKSGKTDLNTRILAVAAYPFLARDSAAAKELGNIAFDNAADDTLRMEAATAFARLATDRADAGALVQIAKKYFNAADEKTKDAAKATNARDKKDNETAAKAYTGYARMFLTHTARIEIAARCKPLQIGCYSEALTREDGAINVDKYIKDIKSWSDDEKKGLREAAIDRAMLEISKQGAKAAQLTDDLLAAVGSENRLIRQAVLRALPKIAPVPCDKCVTALDAAIQAGQGKTTLSELNIETTIVRNYFVWAGR